MRLLMSTTSPYARKCRIVARELGLPVEEAAVDTLADPPALHAANPLGKIPALLLGDGRAIFDSPVICAYLRAQRPGDALAGEGWDARVTEALADGLLDAALGLRIDLASKSADKTWAGRMTRAIERGLPALGERMTGRFDMGAIAALCVTGYLDFRFHVADWPTLDWRAIPALAALDAAHRTRPSVAGTRPG